MPTTYSSEWNQPGWTADVQSWIAETLIASGLRQSRPLEMVQERSWSAVVRVPILSGDLYFKACASVIAFEPALTQALSRWSPSLVPQVLSIDAQRGWMLMNDAGSRAREAFRGGLDVGNWSKILADYAILQIEAADHANELLSFGVRDRSLIRIPELYRELVSDPEWFLVDQKDGVTSLEYEMLGKAASYIEDLCDKLADYNLPATIHHNDLHDGNIFFKDGNFLFFDWGDSSISHPFFSLRTAFVSIEITFGLQESHPIFSTLTSAYLSPWRQYETEERLAQAFTLARRIWSISSAIKYWTIFSQLGAHRNEYASAVPALAKEFLEMNPELRD